MHLKAKKDFSWAHQGVRIEEFKKGQRIETDDEDLIRVSTEEGWAEKAKAPSKEEQKAEKKAVLTAEIDELEAQLVDADDSNIPDLEAQISAKKEELLKLAA